MSDRAARLDVNSEPREAAEAALPPGLFARPHDWRRPRPGGDHTTDPAGAGGDACPAGALVARAARPSVLARTARVEPDRPGVHGAVQLVRLGQIV